MTKMLPEMTYSDYSAVYNSLSFCMAAMGASTVYFFVHIHMVQKQFRTALCITGLVTLIAFYHYFRIFNSWTEAYEFLPLKRLATGEIDPSITDYSPHLTGQPFNDAYRYMDWLLTVPMLLIELILVMGLDAATTTSTCWRLGSAAALMIVLGYPGEISESMSTRWLFWVLAMIPFIYICYELFVGLKDAVDKQPTNARGLVSMARYVTIGSWLTYPFVYVIPMFGASGASALVGVQIGYSISDVISKCGVGLMITKIAMLKSRGSADSLIQGGGGGGSESYLPA